jgi:protein-L-isoaspartate O-methyltransferase
MSGRVVDATTWQAFERKYQDQSDPWDFATSSYESERYETMLRALSGSNYGCIYEPGCSVGALTQRLSTMAARVVATDFAPSAVQEAKARCAGLQNVEIEVGDVRRYRVPAPPDLIVFSEIGYYFPMPELRSLAVFLAKQLAPHGEFLAAHWLGHSKDHVLHGHEVHDQLRSVMPLVWLHGACHEQFRIDCWRKV